MTLPSDPFFGGLSASTSPEALAPGMAQVATNVRPGASLRPLSVTAPTAALHDADGDMLVRVPSGEVVALAKPGAPTVASIAKICIPLAHWLNAIEAYGFAGQWELSSGDRVFNSIALGSQTFGTSGFTVEYTETGFKVTINLASGSIFPTLVGGITATSYTIAGPKFRFKFTGDDTTGGVAPYNCPYGGPLTAVNIPADETKMGAGSPTFPRFALRLYDADGNAYATLDCVSVDAPSWDFTETITADTEHQYDGGYVTFTFECNYASGEIKEYEFAQSLVDSAGREGVPSEPSAKVIVFPGEKLILTLPETTPAHVGTRNLYRGGTGTGQFVLMEDGITGTSWADTGKHPIGDPLPPYGSYVDLGFDADAAGKTAFLTGAVEHPDRYLLSPIKSLFTGGATGFKRIGVAVSDYRRYQAWPVEWFVDLAEPVATAADAKWLIHPLAITGGQVLAFVNYSADSFATLAGITGKVFAMRGRPGAMRADLISDSHPLLNKLGLFEVGGAVGWPTHDGLALYRGGRIEIVTADQYGRKEWADLKPNVLKASVAGDLVILEPDGIATGDGAATAKLIIDLSASPERSVVAYSALTGAMTATWESGVKRGERNLYLDYVKAEGNLGGTEAAPETASLVVTRYPGDTGTVGGVTSTAASAAVTKAINAANLGKPIALDGFGPCDGWKYNIAMTCAAGSAARLLPLKFYERRILEVPPEGITLSAANVDLWENVWLKFPDKGRFSQLFFAGAGAGLVKFTFSNRAGTSQFTVVSGSGTVNALAGTTDLELWRLKLEDIDSAETGGVASPLTQPIESVTLRVRQIQETDGKTIRLGGGGVLPPASSSFIVPGGGELACAQLVLESAAAPYAATQPTLALLGDGATVVGSPITFTGRNFQALPLTLGRHVVWDAAITAALKVTSATILVRQTKPVPPEDLHLQATEPDIREWQYVEYDFQNPVEIAGLLMDGPATATCSLFVDGNRTTTADWSDTLAHRVEKEISGITPPVPLPDGWTAPTVLRCQRLLIRFLTTDAVPVDADLLVKSLHIFLRQVVEIGPEGFSLEKPVRRLGHYFRFTSGPEQLGAAQLALPVYTGSQTISLKRDAQNAVSVTMADGNVKQLALDLGAGTLWRLDLPTHAAAPVVDAVRILPRVTKKVDAKDLYLWDENPLVRSWLPVEYDFGETVEIAGVLMEGDATATIKMYADGNRVVNTPSWTKALTSGTEVELDDMATPTPAPAVLTCRRLVINFAGDDYKVNSFWLFLRKIEDVGPEGWTVNNPQRKKGYLLRFPAGANKWAGAQVAMPLYSGSPTLTLQPDPLATVPGTEAGTSVADGSVFTIARTIPAAALWKVTLPAGIVDRVELIPRHVEDWPDGTLELTSVEGKPWRWFGAVFEGPPEGRTPMSMEVRIKGGASYTSLSALLYADRATAATTPSVTQPVADAKEFAIGNTVVVASPPSTTFTPMARCGSLELDFGADNAKVEKVLIHSKRVIPIDKQGLILRQADGIRGWDRLVLDGRDAVAFTVAQVFADDYTGMKLQLTPEGGAMVETSITGPGDFRLAHTMAQARRWTLTLVHAGPVREVRLLGRKYETVNGRVVIPPESDLFSWLGITVQSPTPENLQFARVKATGAVTIKMYHGATSTDVAVTADQAHPDTGVPVYLPRVMVSRRGFDLIPAAGVEIQSFVAATSPVGVK